MPDFKYNNKVYYNPVEFAMDQIGDTWKMPILWRLQYKTLRYGELRKDIPHIAEKMLSRQLRELEQDGLVSRTVYPVVPPKVEYTLTEKGRRVMPIVQAIRALGLEFMREAGIEK